MVPSASIVRPAGSPVAENVYGPPSPPLPVICTGVIATPCTAVIDTQVADTGGFTVTEQFTVPVLPFLSFTVTVYGKVPLTEGVPWMVPSASIVRPVGRPVAENVYGPPL